MKTIDFFTGCMHAYSVVYLCLTLCDPKDCSPPDSSVRGISQVRILGRVAISSSRFIRMKNCNLVSLWPKQNTPSKLGNDLCMFLLLVIHISQLQAAIRQKLILTPAAIRKDESMGTVIFNSQMGLTRLNVTFDNSNLNQPYVFGEKMYQINCKEKLRDYRKCS